MTRFGKALITTIRDFLIGLLTIALILLLLVAAVFLGKWVAVYTGNAVATILVGTAIVVFFTMLLLNYLTESQ